MPGSTERFNYWRQNRRRKDFTGAKK